MTGRNERDNEIYFVSGPRLMRAFVVRQMIEKPPKYFSFFWWPSGKCSRSVEGENLRLLSSPTSNLANSHRLSPNGDHAICNTALDTCRNFSYM
ncbi:uncharacterized protein BDR25DRAFT_363754 [Lindgomyces ingoldianus]|uniref:Uncharacterized protein n=1 Tax=Lindgomyces ingoldianus TaxID=673940 RepID=A0ACB6Q776_9PLEO|nr:uncharacterized protein BDR25DRAFT_363754 [Lindgomyces ingoldianus]KAF2462647.1 hypothetical protein BDR25DRAFT_363754 [Lindgomyces ingoldianus]